MTPRGRDGPIEILLVEDNPGDVRLTREAFDEADVAMRMDVVADGTEALSYLSDRKSDESLSFPDVVLLDLNLPRTDGFTVLETIEDDPVLARLPVIVLTSSTDREDVLASYGLHANAYLAKPSEPCEFVSLAEAVEEFWFERVRLPSLS